MTSEGRHGVKSIRGTKKVGSSRSEVGGDHEVISGECSVLGNESAAVLRCCYSKNKEARKKDQGYWFPLIMDDYPTPGINKELVFHHPYSS
jgi:hypothetical protein